MRLLLIRHGQTPANVLGRLDTDAPGPGLTETGIAQAAAIPRALRDEPIDALFASPLVRTQLTAAPLAEERELAVIVLAGLAEIEAGDLEDRTDAVSVEAYLSTAFAWADGDLDARMPGATDGHVFFHRFDGAVDDAVAQAVSVGGSTAALFSHGMAIRTWVAARSENITGEYAAWHELDNTGMVTLDSTATGWRMESWSTMPIGGVVLHDDTAIDPTGETLTAALRNAE